jgi:hypothetical protein
LLAYPLFRGIARTKEVEIAGHELVSTNELLGITGNDGIKTGFAPGQVNVVATPRSVNLGCGRHPQSQNRYADAGSRCPTANYAGARTLRTGGDGVGSTVTAVTCGTWLRLAMRGGLPVG